MKSNERYMLDFRLIPDMVRKTGPDFIRRCAEHREHFICTLFNYILVDLPGHPGPRYTPDQFRVTDRCTPDGTHLLYVELPAATDGTSVCCTAYAITYTETPDGIRGERFFSVEKSHFGTTCIGTMTEDGSHVNYGRARGTAEENIEAILAMASRG